MALCIFLQHTSIQKPFESSMSESGSGKSQFRTWMKEKCKEAFTSAKDGVLPPATELGLLDAMIPIRAAPVYDSNSKKVMLADEFVAYLNETMNFALSTSDNLVVIVDKAEFVPVQKGCTQMSRVLSDEIPDEIEIPKGHEGDQKYIKKIAARQKKIDDIMIARKMRQEVRDRGFFIKLGEPLPLPWHEASSSAHRKEILQFVIDCMVYDPVLRFVPPPAKLVILDGHCLDKDCGIFDEDAEKVQTIPIAFAHPLYGKRKRSDTITDVVNGIVHEMREDEHLFNENIVYQPKLVPMADLRNEMGEFDLAFLRHIVIAMQLYGTTSFTVHSCDSDMVFLSLWFLYRLRHCIPSFDISNEEHRQMFVETAPHVQIHINYGRSLKNNEYCDVNKLYDLIVSRCLGGHDDLMPSLLSVIATKASDYTFGYMWISMKTFIESYIENVDFIKPIIQFEGQNLNQIKIRAKAYKRMLFCAYKKQHKKLGSLLEGEKRTLRNARKHMKTLAFVGSNKYLNSNRSELNTCTNDEFKKFMKAFAKQIPPNKEILNRLLLLQGYIVFIHMYGNEFVRYPDALKFGFTLVEPSKGLIASNIKMLATNDWKRYKERRDKHFVLKKTANITYEQSSGVKIRLDSDDKVSNVDTGVNDD